MRTENPSQGTPKSLLTRLWHKKPVSPGAAPEAGSLSLSPSLSRLDLVVKIGRAHV